MWLSDECALLSSICSFVPYYMFLFLSVLILLSPVDPTRAAQDFTAYRLTQFDAFESAMGSRTAALSCDIQTISARTYARRCIIMKLAETTMDSIKKAITNNAGGIIIMLPSQGWSNGLAEHWLQLESDLISEEFQLPVYFATESEDLELMYSDLLKISNEAELNSGPGLIDSIFSTGYRVYTPAPAVTELKNVEIVNIEGKISPNAFDDKKPTVILTAYYDAGGAIPALSYGADANAAGVTVLLEVARIIAQTVDTNNMPKYNIVFLLTGGGKYNFLGAKRWLEMNLELTAGIALLDSVVQVISLEGLGTNVDNLLRLHVSRMPKEGTFGHKLLSALEVATKLHPLPKSEYKSSMPNATSPIEVVHKKINLNQYDLAWEHERFSLQRLPTATFSSWPSPSSYAYRNSVLDGGPLQGRLGPVKPELVARNARVLAEALTRIMYEIDPVLPGIDDYAFVESEWSTESTVSALLDVLTMRPRSTQLLSVPSRSGYLPANTSPGLIASLEQYMHSILPEVRLTRHQFSDPHPSSNAQSKQQKRDKSDDSDSTNSAFSQMPNLAASSKDPEIILYSSVSPQTVIIYRLKSSVFDLVIACIIGIYLYGLYFSLEHFHVVLQLAARLTNNSGKKLKSF